MAATIKCEQAQKQEIKEILLKKLGDMMDSIREDEDCVSVTETEEGLSVDYPIGEIYGYSSDYVQSIPYIFKDLKKKYPSMISKKEMLLQLAMLVCQDQQIKIDLCLVQFVII